MGRTLTIDTSHHRFHVIRVRVYKHGDDITARIVGFGFATQNLGFDLTLPGGPDREQDGEPGFSGKFYVRQQCNASKENIENFSGV